MSDQSGKVLRWIGRGGLGLAVFFVLWVGFMIIGFCFPQWTRSVLRGKVIESGTGKPVEYAKIWTFSGGVWSESLTDSTHANWNGLFLLVRRGMGATSLHARATGYAPFDLDTYDKGTITIRLAKLAPDHAAVRRRYLYVRANKGGVWQSCLLSDRASEIDSIGPPGVDVEARSAATRDFSILLRESPDPAIKIRCWGKGGIVLADSSSDEYGEDQFVSLECVAPDTGYVQSLVIRPGDGWQTCFLRSADGAHFARIALMMGTHQWMERPGELKRVMMQLWYNESGGRGVCSEK